MISRIPRIGIVAFLGWIALFPQPLHDRYRFWIILFLVLFLFLSVIGKKGLKLFDRYDISLWLFFLCFSCGLIQAVDIKIALNRYIAFILPAILIYLLVKNETTEKSVWLIAKALCLFSAIVAFIGIMEWIFARNLLYERLVPNPFYNMYIGFRLMSTQLNPVVLASLLLVCLPINFLLVFFSKTDSFKRFATVSSLLNITVLILTFTRGALIASGISLGIYFLWIQKGHLLKWLGIVLLLLLFCGSFVKIPFSAMGRFDLMNLFLGRFYPYATERILLTLKMLKEHPFVGVGLEHYRYLFDVYFGANYYDYIYKIPDNMYLMFLAETGIIGFSAFAFFVFSLLKRAIRIIHSIRLSPLKGLFSAFVAGLIGLLVAMFNYDALYWAMPLALFWLFVAVINGLANEIAR